MMILVFKTVLWILFLCNAVDAIRRGSCSSPRLPNGRVRYKNAGRKVLFYCYKPYTLVGHSKLNCVDSEWDGPIPLCARKNCPQFPKILNGKINYYNEGAVAKTSCDEDFTLISSPEIYCGETGWDSTEPECQANSITQFDMCHFEPHETQQCKWVSKPMLFNWTVLSSDLHEDIHKTATDIYPKTDHSLAPHEGGHFLYLETIFSPSAVAQQILKTKNAAAKYISPLFPPIEEKSEKYCLIFYLYVNGLHPGNIQILIGNDTIWESHGNRGDKWDKVKILLQYQPTPFRITIEGMGQLGFITNTAIDDLKIAQGDECNDDIIMQKTETITVREAESRTTMTTFAENEQNQLTTISNHSETEQTPTSTSNPLNNTSTSNTALEVNQSTTVSSDINSSESIENQNTSSTTASNLESGTTASKDIPTISNTSTHSPNSLKHYDTEAKITTKSNWQPSQNFTTPNANVNIIKNESTSINSTNNTYEQIHANNSMLNDISNAAEEILHLHPKIITDSPRIIRDNNTTEEKYNSTITHPFPHLLNDTVVKSNYAKYKYSHHEENNRNEIKQEGNNGHYESSENDLENKQNHENLYNNPYNYKHHKETLVLKPKEVQVPSNDHFKLIFLLITMVSGISLLIFILLFSVILKKYRKFCSKHVDESSLQFFQSESNEETTNRRDEVLAMNSVSNKI